MAEAEGKHILLELLRDEGVEVIFGNPGSTELALMDALVVESTPRYVLGLHEGVVLAMAHGYSVASGRLCAVNLHAAPGLGNALGVLYNSKKTGAPILVTAGQQDASIALTEPLLWDDLATIARPFVKWSYEVQRLADLPRAVRRAAKVAMTPPTGPVFLSLPGDILSASADLDLGASTRIGPGLRGDLVEIERAAEMIAKASSPVIFAGDIVAQRDALAEVARLAERIGAPVFLEAMADRASFPSSHPLFAGAIPRLSPAVRRTLGPHDLIVSIGGDLFTQSLATGLDVLEPGRAIVHLDVDPWEIGKNHAVGAAILGDPKASLPDLLAAIDRRMDDDARGRAQERRVSSERQLAVSRAEVVARAVTIRPGEPLRAINLLAALGSDLPADTIIIEELLSSNPGIRDLIRCDLPDSFFGLRGGGIGMAAPQAVGAKIAKPDRPVVALIGDGSALYSIQVLWTAAHERLAVVFIIFNNRSYHILKQRTRALGGHSAQTLRFVAMDLDDPPIDFVGLATSLGVPATRVATLDDFRNALAAALAAKTPRLIDVTIQSEL